MLAVTLIEVFGVAAIGVAAITYVVDRVLDATGKSRSSKLLRTENEDLVRRNNELGSEVGRLEKDVEVLRGQIRTLETLVEDLRARDQTAVLLSVEQHEANAGARHERMLGVLTEIRDAVKAA